MKVLFLSTSFPRWEGDGVVNFVYELARSLSKRATVTVLTPNFPDGKRSDGFGGVRIVRFNYFLPHGCQRVVFPDGIPVQLKKSRLARLQAPFFMLCFVMRAICAARRADILLCNWALTGFVAMIAQVFSHKPYVVIVRGSDMKIIEGGGLLSGLFMKALKNADAVSVVASDFVAPLKARGVKDVLFTPNGVDMAAFTCSREAARQKLKLGGEKIVLFVGSLIEVKGLTYLLDAMRDTEAQLVIVGDGNLRIALEERARGARCDVRFVGQVLREDVSLWFAACDFFVLPSLSEGRPNVVIEALAAGRACVATDIPGTRELIQDGVNGYLVEAANPDALKNKIELLLNDDELRETQAARARAHVMALVPSWDECAGNYEIILNDVLQT